MQQKKGFTLIELLVVIAIIGILSAIGLVSLSGAREKARDSKRKSDLATVSTALQLYYDDQSPNAYVSTAGATGTQDVISTNLAALQPNYINVIPATPSGAGTNTDYRYRTNGTTSRTIATKSYPTDNLFWLAVKLESGAGLWYLLNNVGFGGDITGSGAFTTPASITCDGETAVASTIDGCSRTPSVN